jgi:hypothetical protein
MAKSKNRPEKPSITNAEAASAAPENGHSQPRPEIVKSASRPSVVPFSLEEEIRRRAYELYKQRGPNGTETDDWLVAEREIRQRYQEHRA